MAYFHFRCGERITLLNDNCTAVRNDSDFDNGLVITAEPLVNDILFEIKIDRKVDAWSGSLEIGVVDCDPLRFDFPPCSSKIQVPTWMLSSGAFFHNGSCVIERYGIDLDTLNQEDRVGLMRTGDGELVFYVNGESQGVAAENIPSIVYAVVDVYGKCVQISITSPALREHNNDDCLSGSSVLAIDNDVLNVTLGGDLSELSMSSSNSLDIRMDMNVSLSLPEENPRHDRLRFHERCGSLVKLSNGHRTAERRRPLDEFNNGVVMTHRPLKDNELFEIRIDRLVDKWSGSIEMGITTHNPTSLVFPATMTNMRSGTIMMSGCGILTNGKGTRREYGDFNLDELSEGDRVGMMRKTDGNLHYFINGLDQGVAAQRVPVTVWGVIDLYGMTIKVSIVERDEREEQNLMTRKNTRDHPVSNPIPEPQAPLPDYYDRLTFHPNCGTHAKVINNGRTAQRPNAADDFNNGVVLTARPLKTGELFEVRLDRVVSKWAGSIEIGVTTHSPVDLEFPFTMTNVRSGTWMMTGSGIMHNGTIVLEQYGVNLDRLWVGDRVGVVRKENGFLHFFVNSVDQGVAATNVPEKIYGVIDLYGQAVEASIIDMYDYGSPETMNSSMSNTTLYSDLRFHHVHGKNARISNGGLTAFRPRPLSEFNDSIVFSSRPLRDGELFEVCLESVLDRWSGSIELGVTAVRPDDIELPHTATDLLRDTWMLSGSSVMENGSTLDATYPLDLDSLTPGTRVGVMRTADRNLEFYRDGVPQGPACVVPHGNVYAVVDLYGQCARIFIPCTTPMGPSSSSRPLDNCAHASDSSVSLQATSHNTNAGGADLHVLSESCGGGVILADGRRSAKRQSDVTSGLVFSATPLVQDELFEIALGGLERHLAGSLAFGVTEAVPSAGCAAIPVDACYLCGNELKHKNKTIQLFVPSLLWLRSGDRVGIIQSHDGSLKVLVNGEELSITFPPMSDPLYVLVDLRGQCTEITVTSHRVPSSPLNSIRLQDSLELVVDSTEDVMGDCSGKESPQVVMAAPPPDSPTVDPVYEFHENHGRNVELLEGKSIARRVASYNQGVVVIQPPLDWLSATNNQVHVIIDKVEEKWQSSVIVGVVSGPPDRLNLPVNALCFKGPCCIVAHDWISINGTKTHSNYGQDLNNLSAGDTAGLMVTGSGLKLVVNGTEGDLLPCVFQPGQPLFAVFDLYGRCQQIRILNSQSTKATDEMGDESGDIAKGTALTITELEKANLECCEKERLSLPIPSASTSMASSVMAASKIVSPSPLIISPGRNSNNGSVIVGGSCAFKEECVRFKNRLLLPDHYFMPDEPICYCPGCFKNKIQVQDDKDNPLVGWVRFMLKNGNTAPTEKWHHAFYPTKVGVVRCILDRGQPLTKGQSQWGSLVAQKEDDVQVVFYPNLDNSPGFKLKNSNQEAYSAFQLLVKPGAYSINRDPPEWTTKESGAIALHSLLIKMSPSI